MTKKPVVREEPQMVSPNLPVFKFIRIEMMDEHTPEITFEGKWNGKDLSVVLAHLKRQYPLYIRSQRRNSLFKREEA